ncbi:MAG: CHAT domain-containing protein [Chloroflexi bacterium]|nr:CHAT domain-containing protein [Chloroflexota bacterium]MBU1751346.1 CHAT domain-containing protein [Chloroflexota bacterium]
MSIDPLSILQEQLALLLPDLPDILGPRWPAFRRRLQGILARAAMIRDVAQAQAVVKDLVELIRDYDLADALALPDLRTWRGIDLSPHVYEMLIGSKGGPRPTRSGGTTPGFAALAESLAARVARHVDVYCPAQVAQSTARFPITVGLTIQPNEASAIALCLQALPDDAPVMVSIRPDTAGFKVLGEDAAPLTIYVDRDSPPATFFLQPLQKGTWDVTLEFHQHDRLLGTATLRPEVVDGYASGEPLPAPPVNISLLGPDYLPVPDVDLRIRCRDQAGTVVLEFEVNSPLLDRHAFRHIEPLTLTMSPEAWQAATFKRLSQMAGAVAGTADALAELKNIGQYLYRELFPPGLKALCEELRAAGGSTTTLLITSDEPWIPWELAWPYDVQRYAWEAPGPLAVQYRVGRWLASGRSDPYDHLHVSSLACVVPGGSGLAFVDAERQAVKNLMLEQTANAPGPARALRGPNDAQDTAPPVKVQDVSPARDSLSEVSALLDRDYDLLHLAGHGQYFEADPVYSALVLEGGKLYARNIVGPAREGSIHRNRPLVFLNACEVGRVGYGLAGIGGWAQAFVEPGCGAFVGALWEVRDETAIAFATEFYTQLRGGATLGAAVAAAREASRRDDDPTWLAYALYGHPAAQVRFGE